MRTKFPRYLSRWKIRQSLRHFIQSIGTAARSRGSSPAVYLLPTSRFALRCLSAIDLDDAWAVIANKTTIPARHARLVRDPASAIKAACCSQIQHAISFPDQHVDSHVASIFDTKSGEYFSGVEIVICQHLNGEALSPFTTDAGLRAGPDLEGALNLLRTYYQQCDQLGEDWLARSLQKRRRIQERELISEQVSSFVLSSVLNSVADIASQDLRDRALQRALRLRESAQ